MDITTAVIGPLEDIHLALKTAASLQASIRHADTKAQILLGVDGGVAAITIDHASRLIQIPNPAALIALAVAALGMVGLGISTGRLLMVIAPQLLRPSGRNRFAFPSVAARSHRPDVADVRRCRIEAWELVSTLATIASRKHINVRRSLVPLAVAIAAATALFILAFLPTGLR